MHEWMGLSCRGFCFVGHPRREAPRTSGVEAIRCVDSGHHRVTPRRPTPRPGSPVHAVHSGRGGAGRGEARVNTRSTATVCSTNSQTRGVKMKVRSRIKNIILKNNPLCFLSNVFYHFFFEMKCYAVAEAWAKESPKQGTLPDFARGSSRCTAHRCTTRC